MEAVAWLVSALEVWARMLARLRRKLSGRDHDK